MSTRDTSTRRIALVFAFVLLVTAVVFAPQFRSLLGVSPVWQERIRNFCLAGSFFLGASMIYEFIASALKQSRNDKRPLPKVALDLLRLVLFFAALLASMSLFLHQDMSGFLTGSGVVLAMLGFAIRNVVADTFSGIALGLEAPFRIGDWVNIHGLAHGKIQEIGWRTTRLITRDSTYVILPNSQISRQRITNYSAPRKAYRDTAEITLPISLAVTEAKFLMRQALEKVSATIRDKEFDVQVAQYSPTGVTYRVTYFVPQFDREGECRNEVMSSIDAELRAAGVSLGAFEPPNRSTQYQVDV